ncbi:hypothetical protein PTKIN_Ptkin15bG0182500 [Pterospermum kingtungense]
MALTTFSITISLILCSVMLVIVSASDYGYGSKPEPLYKPMFDEEETPFPIAIQGLILCKSGGNIIPIKEAVARIQCLAVNEKGYETAPFSFLSPPTDSNGYYFATLFPHELNYNKVKLTGCKAFLRNYPHNTCNVAANINQGIFGAPLSYTRLLNNKKMKLYSVQPFVFTPETNSISNGY